MPSLTWKSNGALVAASLSAGAGGWFLADPMAPWRLGFSNGGLAGGAFLRRCGREDYRSAVYARGNAAVLTLLVSYRWRFPNAPAEPGTQCGFCGSSRGFDTSYDGWGRCLDCEGC